MQNLAIPALIFAAALATTTASAAGLGPIATQSALGQPLNAEIEITALGPKEFESLTARVASPELYKERGITYNGLVRNIRLTPTKRENGTAFLKVSTIAPMNEPLLDLLVDFAWPGGRLVQKYALALDPPR
jgi:pilus assembly protein FimV